MVLKVLHGIARGKAASLYYSIVADESTDASNVVCVDKEMTVCEEYIGRILMI